MNRSPCPCMPLDQAVRVLAIIDGVLDGVGILIFLTELIVMIAGSNVRALDVGRLVAGLIFEILFVWLATTLYEATNTRNQRACRRWLYMTGALVVLLILGIIVYSSLGEFALDFIIILIIIAFKIYESLVVNAFSQEVMRDGQAPGNSESAVAS
ncbi:unnamed protein product [Orchesella dallaii]|uniref:Uncharacterized protein n=1 Tax=Orchesella dallaii TaxID=48710 RepID=A0ABP1Q3U1_9HEXA